MAQDHIKNPNRIPHKKVSFGEAICTLFHILLLDVVIYGMLVPLAGAYVGGACAYACDVFPKGELLLVVVTTFAFMCVMFCIIGEANYWKRLFAFDSFYTRILLIRDTFNGCIFVVCLICLSTTIQAMIGDKGMKAKYLSEGVGYVFLKTFLCDLFHADPSVMAQIAEQLKGVINNPGDDLQFEHGAAYMLFWAMLTASIAKIVYFNTLFTYLRAMEIFISMKPNFDDAFDASMNPSNFTLPKDSYSVIQGNKSVHTVLQGNKSAHTAVTVPGNKSIRTVDQGKKSAQLTIPSQKSAPQSVMQDLKSLRNHNVENDNVRSMKEESIDVNRSVLAD